jgi:hypothetical protein
MKIPEKHIEIKEIAGKLHGEPVVYIKTLGGLHAIFAKADDKIISLGAAPHKAIAMFLAEKKDPAIKWNEEFSKSDSISINLAKSEPDRYSMLKDMLFGMPSLVKSELKEVAAIKDVYIAYDYKDKSINLYKKEAVIDLIKSNNIHDAVAIRPLDLSQPISIIRLHPDFEDTYNGR